MASDGAGRASGGQHATPVAPDAAALADACYGFHRRFPRRSARRTFHFTQLLAFALFAAGVYYAYRAAPELTLSLAHAAAFAFFLAAILLRLLAAANPTPILWRLAQPAQWPVYTILCPMFREARVAGALIASLEALDYPKAALDIKLLVEADDSETLAAAMAAAGGAAHIEVIAIPPCRPRTKPKALNFGLARARGPFVTVYDAEDRPHPQQLRAALAAFQEGGEELACVQAPLLADNADESWIARQFAAEYAIQFYEILPLLARWRLPFPLGGSSNHFRVQALRDAGGWDSFNVTEDADLGYRLAREGKRAGVIGPPTLEEAPVRFSGWFNQRSRWVKGHMQTWLVLMRNPFRTARDMGLAGFLTMLLVLGGGVLAALVHGPLAFVVLVAALTPYDLLGPADFTLALFGYCVGVFAALSACALSRDLSHARAALTMPLYWPLATLAAARALVEVLVLPHHWAKSEHGVSRMRR